MQGIVKFFLPLRGYGFIVPEDGSDDVFVHAAECVEPLQKDDEVLYDIGQNRKSGKFEAKNVRLA